MTIIFSYIVLFVFSYILVGAFRHYAIRRDLMDLPNQRSSHVTPTPRGGGFVFVFLWLAFSIYVYACGDIAAYLLWLFMPAAFLISLIGYLDDHHDISARYRFFVQLLVAVVSVSVLGGFPVFRLNPWLVHWGWFGSVVAIIAIVWSINLYNFMDGIDGIAAIEALFIFGVGGYFVWHAGGQGLALLVWAMAVIVAGFLLWNKPPAKIFMGDVGSALLGFLVAIFALTGSVYYEVPVLLWVILYGVFWFDATVTLLRRVKRREAWYQAHRSHAYQRLQLKDWSHAKILCGVVVVNIILVSLALVAHSFPRYLLVMLLLAVGILCLVYLLIERLQPMVDL